MNPDSDSAHARRRLVLPLLVAGAVAPLVLVGVATLAGRIDPDAALGAKSVGLFAGVAATAAAISAGRRVAARGPRRAIAWLATAMLAGETAAVSATHFSGTLNVGEGEEGAAWAVQGAGIFGRPPEVEVRELPSTRSAEARLLVGGRDTAVRLGRRVRAGLWRTLVLRELAIAPAFTVARANGSIEGSGLIKLVPGRREWFEVGLLPHRFYVTLTKDPGDAVELTPPVHLRVQRGKVAVYEGDLGVGDTAHVEGLSIVFQRGAPWARLEAGSRPTGAGGLAALVLAAATWALERRRLRRRS